MNVTRMSGLMRDVLVPGREVGAYWIEYLLRHGSTKHLQTRAKDMPFYEVYMLDAWAFLLATTLVIIALAYATIRFLKIKRSHTKLKKS